MSKGRGYFHAAKKDRAKPGLKVTYGASEHSTAIHITQILKKCDNVFTLLLVTGYKNIVFHKRLLAGLPITFIRPLDAIVGDSKTR